MKNNYLQQIESDISNINILLSELKKTESEVDNDYKKFLNDLTSKLLKTKKKIEQNNAPKIRGTHDQGCCGISAIGKGTPANIIPMVPATK